MLVPNVAIRMASACFTTETGRAEGRRKQKGVKAVAVMMDQFIRD